MTHAARRPGSRCGTDGSAKGPADELLAFTVSLPFDRRLAADDLAGSRAHVAMLAHVGLLTERGAVGHRTPRSTGSRRSWPRARSRSRRPTRTSTPRSNGASPRSRATTGAKLHTGRSRNDQVALDLRLYVRREGREQIARIHALQEVLLAARERRDRGLRCRATRTCSARSRCCSRTICSRTSGRSRATSTAGATASRAPTCRRSARARSPGRACRSIPTFVATELGFPRRFQNSLDAVSDRDFVAEALFVATLTQLHLSRIGEEIVLWSTEEFGFVRLADAYATGSSMLPQKKNPDIAELARGKAGRLIGDLTGLARDAEGLAARVQPRPPGGQGAAVRRARHVRALARGAHRAAWRPSSSSRSAMTAAADSPVNAATDLAEHLVEQGTPFREAHTHRRRARAAGGRARRPARRARRRTTRASARTRCRCSNRAARCAGARRRAAADPSRSPASSTRARPRGSRSSEHWLEPT